MIGVDLEDFRAVMAQGKGLVAFGHGQGDGLPCANTACSAAVNHQLLGVERLQNAKGVFVAIHLKSGSQAMNTIKGVMQSMSAAVTDPQALMIYGAVIEPDLPSDIRISWRRYDFGTNSDAEEIPGILDEDIEAVEAKQSREEFVEAVIEHGTPTEQEFACYQKAITKLAKRSKSSEYDAFMNVEDEEIILLIIKAGAG